MTTEDSILKILASLPYFVMAGPDDNSKVLYGCITIQGKSSYVVDEHQMFSGHPGAEANEEQMEAWRHNIAMRVGKLRGALLWNCLGKLVTDEMKEDARIKEFVWRAIHGSGEPTRMSIEEFQEAFKPEESGPPQVNRTCSVCGKVENLEVPETQKIPIQANSGWMCSSCKCATMGDPSSEACAASPDVASTPEA